MTELFCLVHIEEPNRYVYFRSIMELGVMAMNKYFTFLKCSEVETHHEMQFKVILRVLV